MKKVFKRLVIDTASSYLYLALVFEHEVKSVVYEYGHQNHSVTILPSIDAILKKQNIELSEIDEVIVGIGPGSYTGVRIGVSIAKMIGYLNNIPVKTISSLALLASASSKEYIVPAIDARRGNSFIAYLKQNGNHLSFIKTDVLENTQSFLDTIKEEYDFIQEGQPQVLKVLQSDLFQDVENIHDLVPNYLQVTEAERALHQS